MKDVLLRKERTLTGKLLRMLRIGRIPKLGLATQERDAHADDPPYYSSWEAIEAAHTRAEHNISLAYSFVDQKERFRLLR